MRTSPQNKCFHKWCEVVANHVNDNRKQLIADALKAGDKTAAAEWKEAPPLSKDTIKELVLQRLGNTKTIFGQVIPMRSHKYRMTEAELTPAERKAGYIAMDELLMGMECWAAMDLGLKLVRDETD